jgi:hypothetical protein
MPFSYLVLCFQQQQIIFSSVQNSLWKFYTIAFNNKQAAQFVKSQMIKNTLHYKIDLLKYYEAEE